MSSIYDSIKHSKAISETEHLKNYSVISDGTEFIVSVTKKRGNKLTEIVCENSDVLWKQQYRFSYLSPMIPKSDYIYKAEGLTDGKIRILVINGKPATISGLDNGIFASAQKFDRSDKLYVMSMKAFKQL